MEQFALNATAEDCYYFTTKRQRRGTEFVALKAVIRRNCLADVVVADHSKRPHRFECPCHALAVLFPGSCRNGSYSGNNAWCSPVSTAASNYYSQTGVCITDDDTGCSDA
jgi:hypothetical protein